MSVFVEPSSAQKKQSFHVDDREDVENRIFLNDGEWTLCAISTQNKTLLLSKMIILIEN